MDNFTCEHCSAEIIDSDTQVVYGCEHFPKDDLIEYSGKLISDGISQEEADWAAIKAIQSLIPKQFALF